MSDKTIDRLTERAEIDKLRAINAELLEALKGFVAAETEWVEVRGGMADGTFDDPLGDACIVAKAAIRLAEGQP